MAHATKHHAQAQDPGSQKRPAVLTHIHALTHADSAALLLLASSHTTPCDNGSAAARWLDACSMASQPDAAIASTVGRRRAASDSMATTFEMAAAEAEG